jgi:ABC-type Fe3+/spermidine/putrescine transport system ATPase subunit
VNSGFIGEVGASVTVAVRPEAFSFEPTVNAARGNELRGVVVEATFLGNIADYQVDVGDLILRVQGERRDFREVGSEVVLSVPIEDCVTMQSEPDAEGDRTSTNPAAD